MIEYNYVAYYSAGSQYEYFETYEKAKNWLEDIYLDCDDYPEESCTGEDFISKITHRSKFVEKENREKDGFKWVEKKHGFFNSDREEWPHDSYSVGNIEMVEVKK